MTGEDNIREVIAFPKVKDASCLMTEAPTAVDAKQLEELSIETIDVERRKINNERCEEIETIIGIYNSWQGFT